MTLSSAAATFNIHTIQSIKRLEDAIPSGSSCQIFDIECVNLKHGGVSKVSMVQAVWILCLDGLQRPPRGMVRPTESLVGDLCIGALVN
jgi:hypothetical protein